MDTVPQPKEVMDDLSDVLVKVHNALEVGTDKTRGFFDKEGKAVDYSLGPSLVRYWAKQELKGAGQIVKVEEEGEEEEDFSLRHISNLGLYLTFGKYHIRILKANHGDLPVPGHSKARQAFYNQQMGFVFEAKDRENPPQSLNLIILWEITHPYNLKQLSLVCPKSGDTSRASVASYWQEEIPHPILSIKPPPMEEVSAQEGQDDLDMTLKKEEKIDEENAG